MRPVSIPFPVTNYVRTDWLPNDWVPRREKRWLLYQGFRYLSVWFFSGNMRTYEREYLVPDTKRRKELWVTTTTTLTTPTVRSQVVRYIPSLFGSRNLVPCKVKFRIKERDGGTTSMIVRNLESRKWTFYLNFHRQSHAMNHSRSQTVFLQRKKVTSFSVSSQTTNRLQTI